MPGLSYICVSSLLDYFSVPEQWKMRPFPKHSKTCIQHKMEAEYLTCSIVCACVRSFRDRATAEQCLKHPWLQSLHSQETQSVEILPVEDPESSSTTSSSTSSRELPSSTATPEEEEDGPVTEELIVMAAYTLGQCRQSSTSEKEALAAEQKAISKRFKFEEPFSALQEVPGEFIYWPPLTNLWQCCLRRRS